VRKLRRMSGYSKGLMLRVLATVDRRGMLRKEGIETFSASDFHSANTPFRGIVFDPVGKRRSLAKQQPPIRYPSGDAVF
jgi:hypothetical protein